MSHPTQLDDVYHQVDTILHIFDLHACDLPEYYSYREGSHMPELMSLIDENRIPHVQIAGQFTNWIPVDIDHIVEPDLYSRYDRYFDTVIDLWPSHRYEIVLPPDRYQYKWIVDGEWKYARSAPLVYDPVGNINNFIDTFNCTYKPEWIEQDRRYNEHGIVREYGSLSLS